MAKVKPLPMPIEAVLDSRHLKFAPGSIYRAVITISCRFWASGGGLDGFSESTAYQISQIELGHWNRIKTPVMTALADILPMLERQHIIAQGKRDSMRAMLRGNGEKGRRVMQERRNLKSESAVEKSTTTKAQVIRTPATYARVTNPAALTSPVGMVRIGQRVESHENRLSDV